MASPVNNANQKVKTILNKILEEYELGAGTGIFRLETKHFLSGTGFDNDQFLRVLGRLEKDFIIESFTTHATDEVANQVCIIKPLGHFRARAADYIESLSEDEQIEKFAPGSIIYLTESGDLWHGDKSKFCYPMRQLKERLSIVRYLIKHKDYQSTKSLAANFGKTEQAIRTTINKIQSQIKIHLDIEDLIENSPGPGYRINPKYQIKETK